MAETNTASDEILAREGLLLKPGDHLLFSRKGIINKLIEIKTWSKFSHVEIYLGNRMCFTARNGIGVKIFPLDLEGIGCILRPKTPINLPQALEWSAEVINQSYDWLGLFRFFTLGKQSQTKQFCSEAVTRFDRAGGFDPFAKTYDADLVSPGMFYSSPSFDIIKEF